MKWPIILQSEGSAALRTQDSLSGQCSSHTHLTFMEMTGITGDYNKQRYVYNTLGWCQQSLVTNI